MRIIVVTGMSGAGRTSALKAFEDIGYDAVDNLPIRLLPSLVSSGSKLKESRPLAIGIDVRSRDFTPESFISRFNDIQQRAETDLTLLFLDCDDEVLGRRFSETRRRHPLAQDRPVMDGIAQERDLIQPLREQADMILDTSDFSLTDLRRVIRGHFSLGTAELSIDVVSFSYRRGLPREADLVFDVRFLRNPHYVPELQYKTGQDREVAAYIEQDQDFAAFLKQVSTLLLPLLPRYQEEGKSYLTIAFGCTGGRHRSVFLAERIGEILQRNNYHVNVRHRDSTPPS